MNLLQTFIADSDWDEIPAMNFLQDAGIVSDNCIAAADVADADYARAVQYL